MVYTKTLEELVPAIRQVYDKLLMEIDSQKWSTAGSSCGMLASDPNRRNSWQFATCLSPRMSLIPAASLDSVASQRFVADYATVAAPLIDLMQTNREWCVWQPSSTHSRP